jgi:hypothetical protein
MNEKLKVTVSIYCKIYTDSYLGMKYLWFQQMFGKDVGPRGCDIRVVMQLGNDELLNKAGLLSGIFWPDDKAPAGKEQVEVNTDRVFETMRTYMEDHWLKRRATKKWEKWARKAWPKLIEAAMNTPEEECAKDSQIVQPEA